MGRFFVALCFVMALLVGGCSSGADPSKEDLEKMQGAWVTPPAGEKRESFRWVIRNNQLIGMKDGPDRDLVITLDARKRPKQIDLTSDGKTSRGIYDLDGDKLRFYFGRNAEERPTHFGQGQEQWTMKRPTTDLEKMQGTWGAVDPEAKDPKTPKTGLMFMDDIMVFGGRGGAGAIKITLDPGKQPKWIDMGWVQGGNMEVVRTDLGIYELDGDDLKICWSQEKGERPTQFVEKPDAKHQLMILKRAQP